MKSLATTSENINDQYEDRSGSRQIDEALESDIEKLLSKMKQQRLEQRQLLDKMTTRTSSAANTHLCVINIAHQAEGSAVRIDNGGQAFGIAAAHTHL